MYSCVCSCTLFYMKTKVCAFLWAVVLQEANLHTYAYSPSHCFIFSLLLWPHVAIGLDFHGCYRICTWFLSGWCIWALNPKGRWYERFFLLHWSILIEKIQLLREVSLMFQWLSPKTKVTYFSSLQIKLVHNLFKKLNCTFWEQFNLFSALVVLWRKSFLVAPTGI